MNTLSTKTIHSDARSWGALIGIIQDALFDSQHGEAGLQGAKPKLLVLLSRNLLKLDGPGHSGELERFCSQLQKQGVPHSFHCVAVGSPERAAHVIRITLDC